MHPVQSIIKPVLRSHTNTVRIAGQGIYKPFIVYNFFHLNTYQWLASQRLCVYNRGQWIEKYNLHLVAVYIGNNIEISVLPWSTQILSTLKYDIAALNCSHITHNRNYYGKKLGFLLLLFDKQIFLRVNYEKWEDAFCILCMDGCYGHSHYTIFVLFESLSYGLKLKPIRLWKKVLWKNLNFIFA